VLNGAHNILRPIGDFFAGAVNYGSVVTENQKLQHEIGALRQQAADGPSQARQLRELQRLFATAQLPSLAQLPTVTAETTATNPSNFAATITIDKGRSQGVTLGDPVVGAGGLVGQVVQANHDSATVRLITDGQSHVGVSFGSAQTATVSGQGSDDPMTADFIDPGVPVHLGQRMVTNGLAGAQYPPGIPVCFVTSVRTVAGAAQQTVLCQPIANLDNLAYVDVVQWSPSP
jgi:rod shape-determining protein MreC